MKSKRKLGVARNRQKAEAPSRERGGIDNPIVQMFARRFRQWRREQNKMLKEVASDLGLSMAIVSEWENCHRFPSVKTLQSVVEYTGIPVWAYFHPGEGARVKPSGLKRKSGKVRPG